MPAVTARQGRLVPRRKRPSVGRGLGGHCRRPAVGGRRRQALGGWRLSGAGGGSEAARRVVQMAQENDSDTALVQPCSVSESPGSGLERMRQMRTELGTSVVLALFPCLLG